MKRLRVGVVGLKVGKSHLADYAASKSVEEIVACDVNEQELAEVCGKYSIEKSYTDFAAMLAKEKLDAVSIALPNKLHMPMAIQALEAGCHVLCEKPMARTAAEAEKMLAASRRCGKKLMINFNQRFIPEVQAYKDLIDSGMLGEIYFARTEWHRRCGVPRWYNLTRENCGGGALIDLGVHRLDLALWLCGYPEPAWVLGNSFSKVEVQESPGFELEDFAAAMIRAKNGCMIELETSWASHRESEMVSTRLCGSKGGMLISSEGGVPKNRIFMKMDGKLANVELSKGELGNSPVGPNTGVRQAFLDAIIGDTEVPCTAEQGLVVNRIVDAIYKSAETRRPVEIC